MSTSVKVINKQHPSNEELLSAVEFFKGELLSFDHLPRYHLVMEIIIILLRKIQTEKKTPLYTTSDGHHNLGNKLLSILLLCYMYKDVLGKICSMKAAQNCTPLLQIHGVQFYAFIVQISPRTSLCHNSFLTDYRKCVEHVMASDVPHNTLKHVI